MTQARKICANCTENFVIEPEDFDFYKKVDVPPPTFCPQCRLIRRLAWRNERSLYRRDCDKCKKSIISVFPKDSGMTVYCRPCWWSDAWDALEYGADFDPSRPFLVQLQELMQRTPVPSLFGLYHTLQNSDYVNMASYVKNCYFVTYCDLSENCTYGSFIDRCKDSMDNLMLFDSELCYESVNCRKCHRTNFSVDCESCHNVSFSKNCVGCSDCIGCVNLKNKKYCVFNKEYSKEEYEKLAKNYLPDSRSKLEALKKRAHEFWSKFPNKYAHEWHNANISGDYIYSSKNTHDAFVAIDVEDSRFISFIAPGKVSSSYDFTHYGNVSELIYDSLQIGDHASRIAFSWFTLSSTQEVQYSMFSMGCKNSFGIVGLKKQEHCILNKQYSKEAYEKLRHEIIGQMNEHPYKDSRGIPYPYGEFFPIELSPFGYNATTAQELLPLTKEEIAARGYHWKEQERGNYAVTLQPEVIPDGAEDVSQGLLDEVIGCRHKGECNESCSMAFKFTPGELAFYKAMRLPLPALCPSCRHWQRLAFRNPMQLWERNCQCKGNQSDTRQGTSNKYQNVASHFHVEEPCPNTFRTTYAPERLEIVYCEQCYQSEVA